MFYSRECSTAAVSGRSKSIFDGCGSSVWYTVILSMTAGSRTRIASSSLAVSRVNVG